MNYYVYPGISDHVMQRGNDLDMMKHIIEVVTEYFNVSFTYSNRRQKARIGLARALTCYMIRKYTKITYEDMGAAVKIKHPAVCYALRKFDRRVSEALLNEMREIEKRL